MARKIIKQPNGLYAEYSTVVDGFVIINSTAEQIIERARTDAANEAEIRCRQAIIRADSGKTIGPFALTWEEALENHNRNSSEKIEIDESQITLNILNVLKSQNLNE